MKREKWIAETPEVMLLMKLPITDEKGHFLDLCKFYSFIYFNCHNKFFTVSC